VVPSRVATSMGFPDSATVTVDIKDQQTVTVTLPLFVPHRGWYHAPRVTISTIYPLGLLRAWAHLDMDINVLAYPKPIPSSLPMTKVVSAQDTDDEPRTENAVLADIADDISHLRAYQQGDSLRQIAWKTYAKGQGLASKAYESVTVSEQQQWLDWYDFSGLNKEERLSRLCDCALQAEDKALLYGVKLPDQTIPLGSGQQHNHKILRALAVYECTPPDLSLKNKQKGSGE